MGEYKKRPNLNIVMSTPTITKFVNYLIFGKPFRAQNSKTIIGVHDKLYKPHQVVGNDN